MMSYAIVSTDEYLAHHGVLGQKWGVRRYQNKDGSLTPEGKARSEKENKSSHRINKKVLIGAAAVTALAAVGAVAVYKYKN